MAIVRIADYLTLSEGVTGHEAQKSSALVALILLLTFAGAAPTRAASPPVVISDVAPVDAAGAVLVERTEGEFGGDPDGWRMNLDLELPNNSGAAQEVESVEITYAGGSAPADLVFSAETLDFLFGRGIIPANPSTGRPVNRIFGFGKAFARIPEVRVMPFPLPDEVTVSLFFEGYDDPVSITRALVVYELGAPLIDSYAFPGALKDLPEDQYWHMGLSHTYRSHHRASLAQRFAEDWGVRRWDEDDGWTALWEGGDFGNNADYLIWRMPVYAIADGEVVRCANGFRDNPNPPAKLAGVTSDPPTIPGGGNNLWIEHVSGERVLYAHFRWGTIPEYLCPDDASLGVHDVSPPVPVSSGEFLGRVGNSGNSTAPHLHIHSEASESGVPLYYRNVRSFVEYAYAPETDPAPPWNPVKDAAISSHSIITSFGAYAEPGRRANLGIAQEVTPRPALAGALWTASFEATNHGPDAAPGLKVVHVLPSQFSYDSDDGGCVEGPTNTLTCDLGTLQELTGTGLQYSASVDITASIPADLIHDNGEPLTVVSGAYVEGTRFDDSIVNNVTLRDVSVVAESDLSVLSMEVVSAPPETLSTEPAEVTVRARVASEGPSSPMHARLDWIGNTLEVPASEDVLVPTLTAGEKREITGTFSISCPGTGTRTVDLGAAIAPDSRWDQDPDRSNDEATTSLTIECVQPVAINVKPGGAPNTIRVDKGRIPFAILTTLAGEYGLPAPFDATTIDAASVRFGEETHVWNDAGGAAETHKDGHVEDSVELDEATQDGDLDLVIDVRSEETGLTATSVKACAKGSFEQFGETYTFFGCDAVRVVDGRP